jgi:hypothetical protein
VSDQTIVEIFRNLIAACIGTLYQHHHRMNLLNLNGSFVAPVYLSTSSNGFTASMHHLDAVDGVGESSSC